MLSFKLSDEFVASFDGIRPDWGFTDAAGNSVGELVFLRTYSRLKDDGTKESWQDVCRRVVEGTFSIQKDYALGNRLPWSDVKAARSAEEMFTRMFQFKWTPPGRGLWMMGTPLVNEQRNSAALQNCAFVSTEHISKLDPAAPFAFLMEASMLGVGVGFDVLGAKRELQVYVPGAATVDHDVYDIPDTREGWVQSVRLLLESYLRPGRGVVSFVYDGIRPAGAPIRTFGGTAAGPEPLRRLHESLRGVLDGCIEESRPLDSRAILDIANLIGVCVVSGNVRRSAELALGSVDDADFMSAKDYDANPYRAEWGWMSNNSVMAQVGQPLGATVEGILRNGEPGVVWLDLARSHGRLADPANHKDHRVSGVNPCSEQTLESFEMCTLVETYLNRAESLDDFKRTLKFAYLYAKTVTLLPTHWPETNAIMQRNRRIGTSMSGVADFADTHGMAELRRFMDEGYATVQGYDELYSEWLGIRASIKTTTIKPSGTVSILAGASPGVHWTPGGRYFDRLVRFGKGDPLVEKFRAAGYLIEDAVESPDTTVVVYFPIASESRRSEADVSIWEKVHLAATAQRYWSDNAVSVTVSFDPETEGQYIGSVLSMYDGQLKTVSFLPQGGAYEQMPYTRSDAETHDMHSVNLRAVDLSDIYRGTADEAAADAVGEMYCTTDSCEIRPIVGAQS